MPFWMSSSIILALEAKLYSKVKLACSKAWYPFLLIMLVCLFREFYCELGAVGDFDLVYLSK